MYNFLAISTTSSIVLVLIFIFISFFCLFLFLENHKLKEKIKQLEIENKRLLEVKIVKQKNIDSISINKISNTEKKHSNQSNKKIELVQKQTPKEVSKPTIKEETNVYTEDISKESRKIIQPSPKKEEKKLYQKNVFHDKPSITSPVSLTMMDDSNFDLNEFIKNNELKVETSKLQNKEMIDKKISSNIEKQNIKIADIKKNNNIEYLQEISNKIADELKPQTIELTDYEKMQEENAIISYKELITIKDKIMMLDDENETINFIEELKKLRNSLK